MSQIDFDESILTNWASIRDAFMSAVGGSGPGSTTPCKVSVAFVDKLDKMYRAYQNYLPYKSPLENEMEEKTFTMIITLLDNRARGTMTVQEVSAAFMKQDLQIYYFWHSAIRDSSDGTEHLADESILASILANQDGSNFSSDVNKPLAGTSNVSDRHDNASDANLVSETPRMSKLDSMKSALLSAITDPSDEAQDSFNGSPNGSEPGSRGHRQFCELAVAFVNELSDLSMKSYLLIHRLLQKGSCGLLSLQEVSAALEEKDAQLYGVWIETLKKNHLIDVSKLPVVEYLVDEFEQANCDATKVAPSTRKSVLRRKSEIVNTNKKISPLTVQKVESNKFKKVADMKPMSCRASAMHPPTRHTIKSQRKLLKYVQSQQKENDKNVPAEDNKAAILEDSEEEMESDEDMYF